MKIFQSVLSQDLFDVLISFFTLTEDNQQLERLTLLWKKSEIFR